MPRKPVLIVAAAGLAVIGILAVGIAFGAARLWSSVSRSIEPLLGRGAVNTVEIGELAGRLADAGLNRPEVAALLGDPAMKRVIQLVREAPELAPLVQDGTYLKVLRETAAQKLENVADLQTEKIASPDLRQAVEQVQQVLGQSPAMGRTLGAVESNILGLLGTDAFRTLCQAGVFESLSGPANNPR